jgi:hypothetical protein
MIGDMGHNWSRLWFDRLAARYEVTQDSISASKNNINVNPLEPLSADSETWLKNYCLTVEHDLKSAIVANRG